MNIYTLTQDEREQLAMRVAQALNDEDMPISEKLDIIRLHPQAVPFCSMAHSLSEDRVISEVNGFLRLMAGILPRPSAKTNTDNAIGRKESKSAVVSKSASPTPPLDACNKGDRPDHFDAWIDRMSPELKGKIEKLKDLHTKKLFYRSEIERLAADPNHSKEDMSYNSTLCVAYVDKIQAIYDQADIEWNELNGRSVQAEVKKIAFDMERKADKDILKAEKNSVEVAESSDEPTVSISDDCSDEYLSSLTYAEIMSHPALEDGNRKFWADNRITRARKYLYEKLSPPYKPGKIALAKVYLEDLRVAGKSIAPKAKANLIKAGIEIPEQLGAIDTD